MTLVEVLLVCQQVVDALGFTERIYPASLRVIPLDILLKTPLIRLFNPLLQRQ